MMKTLLVMKIVIAAGLALTKNLVKLRTVPFNALLAVVVHRICHLIHHVKLKP